MKRYQWLTIVVMALFFIGGLHFLPKDVSAEAVQKDTMNAPGSCFGVVTTDELFNMLKDKDFTLVNVYTPYEGEMPRTDLFIPYDRMDQFLDQLPADKNAKIVLYCKMGKKSTIAAERLGELGYTNVWCMKGGMSEWHQKGYPLLNPAF